MFINIICIILGMTISDLLNAKENDEDGEIK